MPGICCVIKTNCLLNNLLCLRMVYDALQSSAPHLRRSISSRSARLRVAPPWLQFSTNDVSINYICTDDSERIIIYLYSMQALFSIQF